VVSYWKQTLIAADNRIPALRCDVSTYLFELPPAAAPLTVTAQLLFRRAFQHTMDARDWKTPDILMQEHTLTIQPQPQHDLYLPLLLALPSP
jgi:hypothetical protein